MAEDRNHARPRSDAGEANRERQRVGPAGEADNHPLPGVEPQPAQPTEQALLDSEEGVGGERADAGQCEGLRDDCGTLGADGWNRTTGQGLMSPLLCL